ncbi:RNA degradosome polyphosphate kinase [Clostridium estertheticum]|uniref:RNA degradosome polyphosphate kinase n=1 Tax=Clostridium estertheticum TaxID=238834 RepID=UPI001CF58DDA|nr:RNA degradosome polyphosphate kinase [Clostridium estertheticum]MCB2355651.1 RNA degradosome polyphosphate kinase [Clostridium estertheticum]WAG39231.1 RNA degradosome polyphosphate kinase [Clostridium estertheticum]
MIDYSLPKYFISRELSWVQFNERVLEEAQDTTNPLFERLKFASIVSSNLDEFFMVRVGSLSDQITAKFDKKEPSGLTPTEQMEQIGILVHKLVSSLSSCYNRSLKKGLEKEKIKFLKFNDLSKEQINYVENYYTKNIFPVLTPMLVNQSSPFPLISNKSLNIAILLKNDKGENIFATIKAPSVFDRFVKIPDEGGLAFIFLEDIIKMNLKSLFNGHEIIDASCYRITRNADMALDEEGAEDLLEAIEESLKQRRWGKAVRLEIEKGMNNKLLEILERELEISKDQEYIINGQIDLTFLMKIGRIKGYEKLEYKPIKPQLSKQFLKYNNIFEAITEKDILLHHPYESFGPIVELVRQAAVDSDVLAIKHTLYRVSGNSPIIEALVKAAEMGKQVTVLVELKARFDESNNIVWAKQLEQSGCHVIYGLVGLKTHCKILLVVRREEDGIKRYVHMGTGNYNDVTAKLYTDIGLFTSNPYFGADASALFNMLSGNSRPTALHKFSLAPLQLRDRFLQMIIEETENARKGKKARIIIKVNSLVDIEIIKALFKASTAGVKIDLIVRGICCLKPGIPGVSENITVRSIVGRFLEHSRIFYFYNDGQEGIYLSSADWMTRNLDRRVELLFPIEDQQARDRIKEILYISLSDTIKARILTKDGIYTRIDRRGKEQINSQEEFYNFVLNKDDKIKEKMHSMKEYWKENGFVPRVSDKIE